MKKELLAFFDFVCGIIGIGAGTYFQAPFFSVAGSCMRLEKEWFFANRPEGGYLFYPPSPRLHQPSRAHSLNQEW